MAYITSADISDKVVEQHTLTDYLTEADNEMIDIAEQNGVTSIASIEDDPLHFKIKRYLIAYVCMRVCEDNQGLNNNDIPEMDKYAVKYKQYKTTCDRLRPQISREMITGDIDEARDRAGTSSGVLYRS